MENYIVQYKPFLLFLGKFFLSYLVLTFVYQSYLNQFESKEMEVEKNYQGWRGYLRLFQVSKVIGSLALYLYLDCTNCITRSTGNKPKRGWRRQNA